MSRSIISSLTFNIVIFYGIIIPCIVSQGITKIEFSKTCAQGQEGWSLTSTNGNSGYLYCDLSKTPCDGSCAYTKGSVPSTITFTKDGVQGPFKPSTESSCGELSLPGGLRFLPAKCMGGSKGCLLVQDGTTVCTEGSLTVDFPGVILRPRMSDFMSVTISVVVTSLLIIIVVIAFITFLYLLNKSWRSCPFSGYRVDLGESGKLSLPNVNGIVTRGHIQGVWLDGLFHGRCYIQLREKPGDVGECEMRINPPICITAFNNGSSLLRIDRFSFWGLWFETLPVCQGTMNKGVSIVPSTSETTFITM